MHKFKALAALSAASALAFSGPLFAHPFSGQCSAYPKKLGEWVKAGEALKKAEAEKERAASEYGKASKGFEPLAKLCGPKEDGLASSAPASRQPAQAQFVEPHDGEGGGDGGWHSLSAEDF